jgi:nicotinamide-nucleotide adenylyltransferase
MKLQNKHIKKYLNPVHSKVEEEKLSTLLRTQEKYKTALLIGRFQPLHYGHLYLIKQALRIADKIVIGIGSSNIIDSENPFSADMRYELLSETLKEEGLTNKVKKIVFLPDIPDDTEWLEEVKKRVGEFDVAIGNNDWVNGIFKNVGIPTIEIPLLKREVYQGQIIRKKLRKKGVI